MYYNISSFEFTSIRLIRFKDCTDSTVYALTAGPDGPSELRPPS